MKFFTYLLTLGAGYLIGILWAPRKGASLREEILEHFLEVKEEGTELARNAIEKGKEIKSIAEGGFNKASDSFQQGKDTAMEKGKDIKNIAEHSLNKASNSLNEAKDVAVEKGKELKTIAEDGLNKASDSLHQAKDAAMDTVSKLNKNFQDVAADSKKVLTDSKSKPDGSY
jgi:ElaB/YqjD/DUF883 family membrane-anchored ribosome-binding protein